MSEVSGKVIVIGDIKEFGAKGFQKQDFVIETEEKYPQSILIEFQQDNCDLTKPFKVGDNVRIGINIRGRKWDSPQGETKYFNSLVGWRIAAQETAPAPFETTVVENKQDDNDDLPS